MRGSAIVSSVLFKIHEFEVQEEKRGLLKVLWSMIRDTWKGWPLLTVETEVNGDSKEYI